MMESNFINPKAVLKDIGLKEGQIVADFGCGNGEFTLQIAKIVGDKGKVYAIDVLPSALEFVQGKAKLEHLFNVETIRGNLEVQGGSKIQDNTADWILLTNMLFQSKKHEEIFKEAFRVLKSGGKIIVIDWLPEKSLSIKGGGWAVPKENVINLAKSIGLETEREFNTGTYHYGLIFQKA